MGLTLCSAYANSLQPRLAFGFERLEIGEHRLATDRALPDRHQRPASGRKVDVDPRAEADETDALAGADALALPDEADDTTGNEAGDLHHRDLGGLGGDDHGGAALVELARFVGRRVDETALDIHRSRD